MFPPGTIGPMTGCPGWSVPPAEPRMPRDRKEAVMNDNAKNNEHREQDPVEGSREIVDRELKRQDDAAGQRAAAGKPVDPTPPPLEERPQINRKK